MFATATKRILIVAANVPNVALTKAAIAILIAVLTWCAVQISIVLVRRIIFFEISKLKGFLGVCNDGVQNNSETDIDCGGSFCAARCIKGQKCWTGSDCQSGQCLNLKCGKYHIRSFLTFM